MPNPPQYTSNNYEEKINTGYNNYQYSNPRVQPSHANFNTNSYYYPNNSAPQPQNPAIRVIFPQNNFMSNEESKATGYNTSASNYALRQSSVDFERSYSRKCDEGCCCIII